MLGLIAQLLYGIYQELRFRFYYGPVFHRFLNHKYKYYSSLPWNLKVKYLRIVRDNYEYFEFIPREGLKLNRGHKAIISSAAAQLLLFLPDEGLTYYKRIIVYPDYYNSRITHKRHKGEVNPGLRTIVFSWHGIMDGLARPDDGLNLLLHEFAHALLLEHKFMYPKYEVLNHELVKLIEQWAAREIQNLNSERTHFFRRYAFENTDEFFAVAVENFFERSTQFRQALPELYHILATLFRQDPAKFNLPKRQKPFSMKMEN
jgi:Mlc titration factor MtfA (ptsG expression regulator)